MSAPRWGNRAVGFWAAFLALGSLALVAGVGALALAWGWPGPWTAFFPRERAMRAARAAYDRGDWPAATRLARQALKSRPDDVDGLRLLARASVQEGRDSSAMALFGRLGPEAMRAEDLYLLGLALARSGKGASAREVWEKAVALEPEHAEALFELTRAYCTNDQLEKADRTGKALAGRPGWEARSEALLGQARLARDDPAGAAELWRRASERPPEGPFVKRPGPMVPPKELARAWLRAGEPEKARAALRPLLEGRGQAAGNAASGASAPSEGSANGPDAETYWLLSRVELQLGRMDEARSAWEKGSEYRDAAPELPDPAPYVGSARCAKCHASEFRDQRASRHARTFFRADELADLKLPAGEITDTFNPKVVHTLRRSPSTGAIVQRTRTRTGDGKGKGDGDQVFEAVVEYALGSGDRGLSLVGRDGAGQARELRLSSYPEGARTFWDVTAGHPFHPTGPEGYLGLPKSEDEVRRCLGCHVTSTYAVLMNSGPAAADHSIGCEKCHGPGGNHLRAVAADLVDDDPAIGRPSQVTGARMIRICAQCHSPRGTTVRRDDPMAPRFQSTTLAWSRCFTESNDALDCNTCHNPHRDAAAPAAHYESRCLSCHSTGAARDRTATARTVCPVNPSTGCIACHMPSVGGIVPHTSFTDHFIRVHR